MFVKTSLVVILQDKLEVKGYVAISIFITTYSAILNASILKENCFDFTHTACTE